MGIQLRVPVRQGDVGEGCLLQEQKAAEPVSSFRSFLGTLFPKRSAVSSQKFTPTQTRGDGGTFLGRNISITLQSSSKSFFFPHPAALQEATASDMSLSSPGELEEKSIVGYRAKLKIFCSPQLLCIALMGLVSSPPSLPQPRAGKKRPLVVCQWFVLLSPHKSWWTEMSPQCGVMSGGCL